jgi:nucleolar protein 15
MAVVAQPRKRTKCECNFVQRMNSKKMTKPRTATKASKMLKKPVEGANTKKEASPSIRKPGEDEVPDKRTSKRQKESKEIDMETLQEENEPNGDDDEIDETYSDLDDDQLLELALKDDEEDVATEGKKARLGRPRKFSKKNVLYLGHVPHGFFEHEIKDFLSQFGKVQQVRVSRSKKTGKSRGYAFVQLQHADVAEIVRKTMHGYILMGRSLVCQSVPEEHVHERMFQGGWTGKDSIVETYANARKIRAQAHGKIAETKEGQARRQTRLASSDKARKARLASKGIKYEYSGYTAAKE